MKNKKRLVALLFTFALSVLAAVSVGCGGEGDNPGATPHVISFYVDDECVKTVTTSGNERISLPDEPTKTGYYFDGWFLDEEKFDDNSLAQKPLKEDITVRAKFGKYIHVRYEMNGGAYVGTGVPNELPDGPLPDELLKAGEELKHGMTVIEKENCKFAGWYDNPELSGTPIKMPYRPTGDTVLYADWAKKYVDNLESGIRLSYAYSYDGTFPDGYVVYEYSGTGGDIDIPADYKGFPIIRIGDNVFAKKNVTSVTTHNNLLQIGNSAFLGNKNLERVVISDTVKEICTQAFIACTNLSDVTIGNGIEKLGLNAFASCAWYNNMPNGEVYIGKVLYSYKGGNPSGAITVKNGTVSLADNVFDGKSGITAITLPQSVKYIGTYAFRRCSALTQITLPDNLKEIGNNAFAYSGLTSVVIPDAVTLLPDGVFKNCAALKSVVIGKGVTQIDYGAFSDCGIEEIVLPENVAEFSTAFNDNFKLKKLTVYCKTPCNANGCLPESLTAIYVPAEAVNAYKTEWSDYADKIFAM